MRFKKDTMFTGYKIIKKSFCEVNSNLSEYLDWVTSSESIIIIQQYGKDDVAMIARTELDAIMETIYLLRSLENGKRLLSALDRALNNKIKSVRNYPSDNYSS